MINLKQKEVEKIDNFKFPPLDDLRIDLIKAHGDNKETWSLIESFVSLYKMYGYPVSLSTSKVKIKWL